MGRRREPAVESLVTVRVRFELGLGLGLGLGSGLGLGQCPNPNPNPDRLLEAERRAERVRQLGGDPQHVLRVLADRRLQRRLGRRPLVRPA